jgi:hypothetical protein
MLYAAWRVEQCLTRRKSDRVKFPVWPMVLSAGVWCVLYLGVKWVNWQAGL